MPEEIIKLSEYIDTLFETENINLRKELDKRIAEPKTNGDPDFVYEAYKHHILQRRRWEDARNRLGDSQEVTK